MKIGLLSKLSLLLTVVACGKSTSSGQLQTLKDLDPLEILKPGESAKIALKSERNRKGILVENESVLNCKLEENELMVCKGVRLGVSRVYDVQETGPGVTIVHDFLGYIFVTDQKGSRFAGENPYEKTDDLSSAHNLLIARAGDKVWIPSSTRGIGRSGGTLKSVVIAKDKVAESLNADNFSEAKAWIKANEVGTTKIYLRYKEESYGPRELVLRVLEPLK